MCCCAWVTGVSADEARASAAKEGQAAAETQAAA